MCFSQPKFLFLLLSWIILPAQAVEPNNGQLGKFSSGNINLVLTLRDSIQAGFLRTNLDNPNSEFQSILTHNLIYDLVQDSSTTVPFCVISSSGGFFEISAYEGIDGEGSSLQSEFGPRLGFDVIVGSSERSALKYESVSTVCDEGSSIPVTIKLDDASDIENFGSVYGKVNLLIKTE